jgi:hypothetical protein
VDEPVIGLLKMAGVRAEETTVPAEIFEYDPARTPITADDLLDFIVLLAAAKTPVTHCLPPSNVHTGPPLSAEDLLDLFRLLTATDKLAGQAAEHSSE